MREGKDGLVPMARPAQGDHVTGLALVGAILAALRQAERTGEGQVVETSLYETAVWTQATDFAVTAVDHAPVRKRAREEQLAPTANRIPAVMVSGLCSICLNLLVAAFLHGTGHAGLD